MGFRAEGLHWGLVPRVLVFGIYVRGCQNRDR